MAILFCFGGGRKLGVLVTDGVDLQGRDSVRLLNDECRVGNNFGANSLFTSEIGM